ncbi:MAG TPA: hypothetical protein VGD81_18415 [Opitutaceae bacterium]
MQSFRCFFVVFTVLLVVARVAAGAEIEVSSLAGLARAAAQNGGTVRLKPGVYRMTDYLTADVLEEIRAGVDRTQRRPPVPMFVFRGSDNRFELRDVTIEIDTSLYQLLPQGGYTRCLIVAGDRNRLEGLTIRNTGPNQGSGGNILSIAGEGNTLEDVTLHVRGSFPYGYGDLLGKGGPNLVALQKQSGIQILGTKTTLRRCKVFSRALGHCFYLQGGDDVRLEDCYAEGEMRATSDMLRDTSGPAFALGFRSVYENRDGRYAITPGYMKSLVEDGFRTYGGAGSATLVNCVAVHTRAGFEIAGKDDAPTKTVIANCLARGCERSYLLGSNVVVRRSRGDIAHGPVLYLRGGHGSDIELELTGPGSNFTVHTLATIAGSDHRVRLTAEAYDATMPAVPILLGFGMPAHAEMSSPIRPAAASRITLLNEIDRVPVISSAETVECDVQTRGRTIADAELKKSPGAW